MTCYAALYNCWSTHTPIIECLHAHCELGPHFILVYHTAPCHDLKINIACNNPRWSSLWYSCWVFLCSRMYNETTKTVPLQKCKHKWKNAHSWIARPMCVMHTTHYNTYPPSLSFSLSQVCTCTKILNHIWKYESIILHRYPNSRCNKWCYLGFPPSVPSYLTPP